MRTGVDNSGYWVSLPVGGHLADNWRAFGGHGDNYLTLASVLDQYACFFLSLFRSNTVLHSLGSE